MKPPGTPTDGGVESDPYRPPSSGAGPAEQDSSPTPWQCLCSHWKRVGAVLLVSPLVSILGFWFLLLTRMTQLNGLVDFQFVVVQCSVLASCCVVTFAFRHSIQKRPRSQSLGHGMFLAVLLTTIFTTTVVSVAFDNVVIWLLMAGLP